MIGGFQVGAFQPFPAYQQEALSTGAGRKARGKRRYTIEVDDQEFEVASYEEAVALLERAKHAAPQLAQATAKRLEKRIRRKGKAVSIDLSVPEISTEDESLREIVANYRERIQAIYLEAARSAELRELLRRKFEEQDEDDAETLLLH